MALYQVNRLLRKPQLLCKFLRYESSQQTSSSILYPLESRKLIEITGNDASVFLQGLITNDMSHFEESSKSIYAMFLNNKGRVLYDTLIHKWQDEITFLIECDKNVQNLLQKHLKLYKLRRQVEITDSDLSLWALISSDEFPSNTKVDSKNEMNIYKDPRLTDLGYRVISCPTLKGSEIANKIKKDIYIENNEQGYKYLRYKLGVSEGSEDLPPGSSFPLEANCDYLHGVSFHKGCYIGQELTARVHHTGVVRKRIMPVKFSTIVTDKLDKDTVISASGNPKSNLGKLKGFIHDYGLGLLRVKEVLDAKLLSIGKCTAEAQKPSWWPIEAPKEKAHTLKAE